MLRIVVGLCSLTCLALAAPTVHLYQPTSDQLEDNTELPHIVEPVALTMKPLVDITYVDPVKVNHHPPITMTNHQPVQQQPFYYQPPTYMHAYNGPSYQQQPLYSYQMQWPYAALPQQPIVQPANTNVLPCSQNQRVGGYQQHGY